MRRPIPLLLTVLLLTAPSPLRADVLPPGSKGIRHEYVFVGLKDHPGFEFYLVHDPAWRRGRPPVRLEEGRALTFYKHLLPHVHALARAEVPPGSGDIDWEALPRTEMGFSLSPTVPVLDPAASRVTTVRIDGVEGGRVLFTVLGTVDRDADGEVVDRSAVGVAMRLATSPLSLGAAAALGVALLVILRRRKASA